MEKFKVLSKVEVMFRLASDLVDFKESVNPHANLVKEQAHYIQRIGFEKGERLLMFLPSFAFMDFILPLTDEDITPNSNMKTTREGLIGELKLPVVTSLWTDAMLLPQRYFLTKPCFAKMSNQDFLAFAEIRSE